MDTKPRQQPTSNKRTHYPEEKVTDDSESRSPDQATSQPACNDAYEQYDQ
jgi:hypothetical protein